MWEILSIPPLKYKPFIDRLVCRRLLLFILRVFSRSYTPECYKPSQLPWISKCYSLLDSAFICKSENSYLLFFFLSHGDVQSAACMFEKQYDNSITAGSE